MSIFYRLILLVSFAVLLFGPSSVDAQERKTIKCESRGSQSEYWQTQ
jgi:hypothetical protein